MQEGPADALAAGEWAAFHGRPRTGVAALEHVFEDRMITTPQRHQARWLLGVCFGAEGRYGDALAMLDPLARAPEQGDRWACFAASTAGSLHRQLGRYAAAREFDRAALEAAGTLAPADVEPMTDARVGLAADAVGEGDAERARAEWEEAARIALAPGAPWRARVRTRWVQAEIALLTDEPLSALQPSSDALATAVASRAPRHAAKSLLFRGVVLRAVGDLPGAALTTRRALREATELQVPPLIWPAGAVLAEVLREAPDIALYEEEAEQAADASRRAVGAIASDLPDDLAAEWLARPDVPDPYGAA